MSPSRRDFVGAAGIMAVATAVGGTLACGEKEMEADTLEKLKVAMLNGHWPQHQDGPMSSWIHMFSGDDEHKEFLMRFFHNDGNIDDLLENSVHIDDPGERGKARALGARIPAEAALFIYGVINSEVDQLRLNCGSGESHWY